MGRAIERSAPTLVNWEHGRTNISKADLALLLKELGATDDVREELERLRRVSRQQGWWSVFKLPDWLRPLISFEQDAASITTFEPLLIPGLLQTEGYARAIHVAGTHTTDPADVEKRVEVRMARQRRLCGDEPVELHTIVGEAALRLEVGGAGVMADQLWHLVRQASVPNIRIQVLPFNAGAKAGVASNFTVMHFAEPRLDPPLGYIDDPFGGHIVDDQEDVSQLVALFGYLSESALDEPTSVDIIASIMDEYRAKSTRRRRGKGPMNA
nr:helix-turn-helix transcriptional regulator [Streptoalloteichus tenebrarius]